MNLSHFVSYICFNFFKINIKLIGSMTHRFNLIKCFDRIDDQVDFYKYV